VSLDVSNTALFAVLSPAIYTGTAAVGLSLAPRDGMALHLAVCVTNSTFFFPDLWQRLPRVGVGSVQRLGFRRPPLVEWRVAPGVSAGVFGSVLFPLGAEGSSPGPPSIELLGGLTTWF
jgi:hypothetical protein